MFEMLTHKTWAQLGDTFSIHW